MLQETHFLRLPVTMNLSGHSKKSKKHQEVTDTNRSVARAFAAMSMNSIVSITNCSMAPKMFSLEPCKPVVARKMNGNYVSLGGGVCFFFFNLVNSWG